MIKIAYNELLAKAEAAERNFNLEEAAKLYKQVLDTQIDKSDLDLTHLSDAVGYYVWREYPLKKTYQKRSKDQQWK